MENAEYLRTTLYTSTTNFLCDYFESFGVVTTEPYARVVGIQIEDEEPLWTQRDISDLPVPKTPGMESCFEEGRNDPEPVTYEMPTEKAIRLTSYYKQCLIEEPSDIDTTNCHHFTHAMNTGQILPNHLVAAKHMFQTVRSRCQELPDDLQDLPAGATLGWIQNARR